MTKLNYAKITTQEGKIANKNDFKAKTQRELGSTIRTKSKLKQRLVAQRIGHGTITSIPSTSYVYHEDYQVNY